MGFTAGEMRRAAELQQTIGEERISDLRVVVQVLDGRPRADRHSVHVVVKAIQQRAQELLGVLLTVEGGDVS